MIPAQPTYNATCNPWLLTMSYKNLLESRWLSYSMIHLTSNVIVLTLSLSNLVIICGATSPKFLSSSRSCASCYTYKSITLANCTDLQVQSLADGNRRTRLESCKLHKACNAATQTRPRVQFSFEPEELPISLYQTV